EEAATQYKAVLDKRPSAEVWTLLGILEDGRGNIAGAEAAYRNALQMEPETPIAANNLAWIITENGGNLDEALQLATMAVTKNPQSAEFYDTLGWVYLKKGLNSPAVEQMKKAVAMDEAAAKTGGTSPNAAYRTRLGMALAGSTKG
ncbi:MAG TPA: tetratricopeptide repeat protein, partial [Pyrinomonadaceae bacterium]